MRRRRRAVPGRDERTLAQGTGGWARHEAGRRRNDDAAPDGSSAVLTADEIAMIRQVLVGLLP